MRHRLGSPGALLPGVEFRLEPVEGLAGGGGRFLIRGPNVMLGYLSEAAPGVVERPPDGWHDTGDICEIDRDGFLWIRGRYRRFAKISGEMVSLAAVEEVAFALWPGAALAVMAAPDPARGERLVLVHTPALRPDLAALRKALVERGLADLTAPRLALEVDAIPLSPLGKTDIPALTAKMGDPAAFPRPGAPR
jgi:acyl-[acyl-carrier-protein]-phospholipid O-acyltransferase/long-chain-fatty-acid--[acyl-carrier-protein] ligase